MHVVIIFAVLITATAGYRTTTIGHNNHQAYTRVRDTTDAPLKDTSLSTASTATDGSSESPISSTTVTISSTTVDPTTAIVSEKESESEGEGPSIEVTSELPESLQLGQGSEVPIVPSRRRIVTYDQRQEGQYNIRADLDNFMIVLIPPSPADGLNLLDLLTKSSLKRNSHTSKGKKKHYSSSSLLQPTSTKYRNSLKNGDFSQNFNYLSQKPTRSDSASNTRNYFSNPHGLNSQPIAIIEGTSPNRISEFIEGRTPYHVDISASDDEQSRLHPEHQVDVLPPPYPLAYQHLIKPFHLEAEPTVIQALPPSELKPATGDFLQLITAGLRGSDLSPSQGNGKGRNNRYRSSRAIRSENFLDSNRVTASNSLAVGTVRRTSLPLYRSDLSFGAANLYPPIDVPRFTGYLSLDSNSRNYELGSDNDDREQKLDDDHVGEIAVPPNLPAEDELELSLPSFAFMNSEAKDLLSDSMERCAPGSRRNSYGICSEIEGY